MSSEGRCRVSGVAGGLLLCAALTVARDARAEDIVHLTSGGRVVGVVLEESPESVRVMLANREVKVIPRRDVASIHFEGEAPPTAPGTPPTPPPTPAEPSPKEEPAAPPPPPEPPKKPEPPPSPYEGGPQEKSFYLSQGWRALATASFGGGAVSGLPSTGFEVLVGGSAVVSPVFELDLGIAGRWAAIENVGQATGFGGRAGFAVVPSEVYALRLGLQLGPVFINDPFGGSEGAFAIEAKIRPVELRFGEEQSLFLGLEASFGGWVGPIGVEALGGGLVLGYRPRLGI